MALKKDYSIQVNLTTNEGNIVGNELVAIQDAYIKIINVNGGKESLNLMVSIEDTINEKINTIKYYTFVPNVTDNSVNFIKQGYDYIKTLNEYKDAIDC
jgi:hypothetical protein